MIWLFSLISEQQCFNCRERTKAKFPLFKKFATSPDIFLTDILRPGIDGRYLTDILNRKNRTIKFDLLKFVFTDPLDNKASLVKGMAPSHCLNQWWPTFTTSCSITTPQWVKSFIPTHWLLLIVFYTWLLCLGEDVSISRGPLAEMVWPRQRWYRVLLNPHPTPLLLLIIVSLS